MTLWSHSLAQFVDVDGMPAPTTVRFYRQGSTQRVTVYKDPACESPHPIDVKSDSSGRLPVIYLKPDGLLLRAEFETGNYRAKSIEAIDPGSPPAPPSSDAMSLPAVTKTGSIPAIVADDFGRFVEIATQTGAAIPVALPKATSIANGRILGVRNRGFGSIVLRANGSDLIDTRKGVVIPANGSLLLRATGAAFETFALTPPQPRRWAAKSRALKVPPSSPVAGDTYLAPDESVGGWVTDRIYVANGAGEWVGATPEVGDQVAIADETVQAGSGTGTVKLPLLLTFTGTGWLPESSLARAMADDSLTAQLAPLTARVVALETAAGDEVLRVVSGGLSGVSSLSVQGDVQPVSNAWTRATITSSTGAIAGAAVQDHKITLPKGKYTARCRRKASGQIKAAVGFRNTGGSVFAHGMPITLEASQEGIAECEIAFTVAAQSDVFELVFLLSGTVGALSTGVAAAIPGVSEIYAEATIERLA